MGDKPEDARNPVNSKPRSSAGVDLSVGAFAATALLLLGSGSGICHHRIMKTLAMLMGSLLALPSAWADPLSSADRQALLEKLTALRESADSTVDQRFRLAIAAYSDAASLPAASL